MKKIAKGALVALAIGVAALVLWLGFQFAGIVIYLWQQERYISATILPIIVLILVSGVIATIATLKEKD